jgi:hypothetical protein
MKREIGWKRIIGMLGLSLILLAPIPGLCQESKSDTEALIQLLRQKGVISEKESREFLNRSAGKPAVEQEARTAETEQLQEEVNRLREKLNQSSEETMQRQRLSDRKMDDLQTKLSDINSKVFKSDWAQRIRFGGDIRLRAQGDYYGNNNALVLDPNDPNKLLNTTEDRERFRYRARLAVLASITDPQRTEAGRFEVGMRVATGNEKDPVSTNDTFGDYYNKDGIVLDQAYLKYTYKPSDALVFTWIPQATLTGGRIPNPFFYTDLVWDHDLGFEGLAVSILTDTSEDARLRGWLTAGAFPLQEVEFSSRDKWLYGAQAGIEAKPVNDLTSKLGVAYYDYKHVVGKLNDPARPNEYDYTAPLFLQKGNTLFDIDPGSGIKPALASDYDLVNVTAQIDYARWHPIHVVLTGDYVKNIGFEKSQVRSKTGSDDVDARTDAYSFGMQVGYPNIVNFGEWNVLLTFKYLEADAVMDAFTDSDFHGGGTNAQGWILGAGFGIYHNVWLTARWLTADEVSGPPLSIDVLQVDVNARF